MKIRDIFAEKVPELEVNLSCGMMDPSSLEVEQQDLKRVFKAACAMGLPFGEQLRRGGHSKASFIFSIIQL